MSAPVIFSGLALATLGIAHGMRHLPEESVPVAGLLSALMFVASLIHIPFGIVSVHLVLNGLCGIILGWSAMPVILVVLLLQAMLFGFGGIAVLGVNVLILGIPAVVAGWVFRGQCTRNLTPLSATRWGALTGALSVLLSLVLTTLALWLSLGAAYGPLMTGLVMAYLPVVVIDAIVTALAMSFLARLRPQLLRQRWTV